MAPRERVAGSHTVPGDKSITHRALMLAALAPGESRITGALTSLDARSTAAVLRLLGARISPVRTGTSVRVRGNPRFSPPPSALQCGNSGTTTRLMLGLLAGHPFPATLTGDGSLRRRPMRRVTGPLMQMGASIDDGGRDGLPLRITGGSLAPLDWQMPVASAQIKSALLLAGLTGGVEVTLHEPAPTRDHTERLLQHFGFEVASREGILRFAPTGRLVPFELAVPGDPSSAAFLVAAALLAESGEIRITGVGLNPSRIGFLDIMRQMGGRVTAEGVHTPLGEPMGDLVAVASRLSAVDVPAGAIPGVIDEIPILACLAARASGTSRFRSVEELRVKESDRLALMVSNLRAVGVSAAAEGNDLVVVGSEAPLAGRVVTGGDHRIAMAFAVLGRGAGSRIDIDDPACAAVSFPGFADALERLSQVAA
ncbi:MAG: 3-phosphoshikimate 1-carboxyvinyltransferase [Gemmatimonadota bacterium]